MYPSDKKEDDLNFKRVLQCFLALAMYPFGLKELSRHDFLSNAPFGRFSLAMYPSDQNFLKALFLRGTVTGGPPLQAPLVIYPLEPGNRRSPANPGEARLKTMP